MDFLSAAAALTVLCVIFIFLFYEDITKCCYLKTLQICILCGIDIPTEISQSVPKRYCSPEPSLILSSNEPIELPFKVHSVSFKLLIHGFMHDIEHINGTCSNQSIPDEVVNILHKYLFNKENGPQRLNDFILIDTLGTGSFSCVELGLNIFNQRKYAIKIATSELNGNICEKKLDQLTTESNILSQLSSYNNIITLCDKGKHSQYLNVIDGTYRLCEYLVLEYCSNGDLHDFMIKNKFRALDDVTIKIWFYQIASALNVIHKYNIIHRDIKMANLLLDHNFNIKISDFGMSSYATSVNMENNQISSVFCGTKRYMSPQMINHDNYTHKLDIFALGVIVFVLAHGCFPFNSANSKDVQWKLLKTGLTQKIMNKRANVELVQFWKLWKVIICDPIKELIELLLHPDEEHRLSANESVNWSSVYFDELDLNNYDMVKHILRK